MVFRSLPWVQLPARKLFFYASFEAEGLLLSSPQTSSAFSVPLSKLCLLPLNCSQILRPCFRVEGRQVVFVSCGSKAQSPRVGGRAARSRVENVRAMPGLGSCRGFPPSYPRVHQVAARGVGNFPVPHFGDFPAELKHSITGRKLYEYIRVAEVRCQRLHPWMPFACVFSSKLSRPENINKERVPSPNSFLFAR